MRRLSREVRPPVNSSPAVLHSQCSAVTCVRFRRHWFACRQPALSVIGSLAMVKFGVDAMLVATGPVRFGTCAPPIVVTCWAKLSS